MHANISPAVAACALLLPVAGALAQTEEQPVDPSRILVSEGAGSPYSPRAGAVVYAVGTPDQTGGVFAGSATNVYDDVTFAGSPGPVTLRSIEIAHILPATFPPQFGAPRYLRVTFYPDHNSAAPATFPPSAGTPVQWVVGLPDSCDLINGCPHIVYSRPPITLDNSNVFTSVNDRTCGVLLEPFSDRALTIRSTEWQIVRRAGFASFYVGSSDTFAWFQAGAPPIANSSRSGGGAFGTSPHVPNVNSGNCRATFMTIYAAIPCDADFNGDGDAGTDADIESFFRALGGGGY